jgi:hypothetical protein
LTTIKFLFDLILDLFDFPTTNFIPKICHFPLIGIKTTYSKPLDLRVLDIAKLISRKINKLA